MERRKFLRDVAVYSAGLGLVGTASVLTGEPPAIAAGLGESVVSVVEGKNWAELVRASLAPLGGIKAFVKAGDTVVVKPNISFDRAPEQAANTHPVIVKSVVQLCLEAGAKQVKIFDGTLFEKRRCYVNSGIAPALEAMGDKRVNVSFMEDRKFVPVNIPRGVAFRNWEFYKEAMEANVYINVPVAKVHKSAGYTLGLKNILGIIGGMRQKIHWNLAQGISDLNTVRKTNLTIIDGTRILLRNGPSGGNLDDVAVKNTVIASADVAAADAYAMKRLFNVAPNSVESIKVAGARGIGQIDLAKIKVMQG